MDFDEFLDFRADDNALLQELQNIRENTDYISLRRKEILAYLDEYLTYGGYPAVVITSGTDKKKEKIRELISSYLKRDILESGIKSEETLFNLLKILAGTQNSLVNTFGDFACFHYCHRKLFCGTSKMLSYCAGEAFLR